ncbi:MAG TPA: aldolase [Burkholderiaceae bacterium]|jgi:ribulose-5-phosphate 4-epimerase/fuculose-1-phosphate aldolase
MSSQRSSDKLAAIRAEICRVGRSLFERGYVHSTAGNISVRLADEQGFLITPTDACLGFLEPEALAWVGLDGVQRGGAPASKTLALHRRIYQSDADAQCVIHTHSTHLVAVSLGGAWRGDELLPPITPYYVMKVGHVPLIAYRRPGDTQSADAVEAAIGAAQRAGCPIRAVMLERLGPNVWHRSPGQAMATLEELEETARLWLASGRTAEPLSEAQIDELRASFGARW